jgi:hypothetical protein
MPRLSVSPQHFSRADVSPIKLRTTDLAAGFDAAFSHHFEITPAELHQPVAVDGGTTELD